MYGRGTWLDNVEADMAELEINHYNKEDVHEMNWRENGL